MTLIATAIAPHYSIQVSDRRMSFPDGEPQDIANKAICVSASDGQFSIACTGHGSLGTKRTDRWLTTAIGDIQPGEFTVDGILNGIANALNSLFATLAPEMAAEELTLVVTGFREQVPFIATVSNRFAESGRRGRPALPFVRDGVLLGVPKGSGAFAFAVFGAEWTSDPRPQEFLSEMRRHDWLNVRSTADAQSLERRLVQFIRDGGRLNPSIGFNCLSVVTVRETPVAFFCSAPSVEKGSSLFVPQVVTQNLELQDAEFDLPSGSTDFTWFPQIRFRTVQPGLNIALIGRNEMGRFVRLGGEVDVAIGEAIAARAAAAPHVSSRRYKKRRRQ
jgi:hypothetical protein